MLGNWTNINFVDRKVSVSKAIANGLKYIPRYLSKGFQLLLKYTYRTYCRIRGLPVTTTSFDPAKYPEVIYGVDYVSEITYTEDNVIQDRNQRAMDPFRNPEVWKLSKWEDARGTASISTHAHGPTHHA